MKGLIGERVFHLYAKGGNGSVSLMQFLNVSYRFFQSSFDVKLKLVFDVFDIDSDGFISDGEIRTILSHIPLDLIVFMS